jgi:hypothetical protein
MALSIRLMDGAAHGASGTSNTLMNTFAQCRALAFSLRPWPGLSLFLIVLGTLTTGSAPAATGFLQVRNGYFWDSGTSEYFIPRGIAYQSWNPPVGADQSFEQLDYDLLEFKKMYANSVRCEFVWGEVEVKENQQDWSKPDHLVAQAEKLGFKLFVIIGFQYPPAWFPAEWRGINDQGLTPDVLQCLATNTTGSVTNCLPPPLYNCIVTNFPSSVSATIFNCLTSSVPSEIIACLRSNVPADHLQKAIGCLMSDVVNYEHPEARRVYTNHIAKVVTRYRDSKAIGAWIMGNEMAYFDLWESPTTFRVHRFIGYDPVSQAAFREYLRATYAGDIAGLNRNWRTGYAGFADVQMPKEFPGDRSNPAFHDVIQWRQQSIGKFVASGALTARSIDPNHMLTYSMVGGIFNGNDANNTCEDAKAIVAACKQAGAPLDFWSINNYAWASLGSELRTGDFGVSKYQEELGLPVMLSETGHSSTEDLPGFEGAQARQAKAVPGQIWESLLSGAVGTHIFHWSDRDQFTRGYFNREKGFGIVHQNRRVKDPIYYNTLDMFRRMREIRIDELLGGSKNPPADVLFYWSKATDIGWPRANQENAMLWGVLKRLGYQPGIIDDAEFVQKLYTNAPVLLLSRAWQLDPRDLDTIASEVIPRGIHLHANADLPGQFDAYLRTNANWIPRMRSLFGLGISASTVAAYHSGATNDLTTPLSLLGADTLGAITPAFRRDLLTWRVWHGVQSVAGRTILRHTGLGGSQPASPALQVHTVGAAKTAINTFGLGDSYPWGYPPAQIWDLRYDILRAIYRNHFGLIPKIDISGPGAKHVISDYRVLHNGSVFVSLLNEHTNRAVITLSAPSLLAGKTIESITAGGIIETASDGILDFTLADDDYVLLYAYERAGEQDHSLINPSPQKLWFAAAPLTVWPRGTPYELHVGYDTQGSEVTLGAAFENEQGRGFSAAAPVTVNGKGVAILAITVPDADLNDPDYASSQDGGSYRFRASLSVAGAERAETTLPVRLAWPVRPTTPLPQNVVPGGTYQIGVEWEELPSYEPGDPMPLARADLWDQLAAKAQHYNVVLELRNSAGQLVASGTLATSTGTSNHTFTVRVPPGAQGPFTWSASLQTAPGTGSLDVCDGFEGRERGLDRSPLFPWFTFTYADPDHPDKLAEGVESLGGAHKQVAYLDVRNPLNPGPVSTFGMILGTNDWSLPGDRLLWTNLVFSFDFQERNRRAAVIELQVKDANDNWLQFTKPYDASSPDGWDTVSASLDLFVLPGPGAAFDPTRVRSLVANIRMIEPGVDYRGLFDNISFTGAIEVFDGFEDRYPGPDYSRIAPWIGYGYDALNHNDIKLDQGVHLEGSEGSQSAFIVSWYRTDSGDFAGFGMFRPFAAEWALPQDTNAWKNYLVSLDFKERFGKPCLIELQLKNRNETNNAGLVIQRAIHFVKTYTPGAEGWDRVRATVADFVQPSYFERFDPTRVDSLVVNIQMLERNPANNVLYVGSFDNILFDAPEAIAAGGAVAGVFTTANDLFGFRAIERLPDGRVRLSWVGSGTLEVAEAVAPAGGAGGWQALPGVSSPATLPADDGQRFYRLRR